MHHSRTMDLSRGFLVNRCALYWTGYNATDGFDGQAFVDSCQDGNGSLRQLAQILDTDLQIFELDPHNAARPTVDDITMAASYGMMGVEENTQLFAACSFGKGVESASIDALNALSSFDNLENFMTTHCGLDHAALLGAAIACVMKGIPMIVEGASGQLVKTLLERATDKKFSTIILTDEINLPLPNTNPGEKMVTTAITLKSLYTAMDKTDCGKIKAAA